MIGTHECDRRCDPEAGEHVTIVYPGAPGRPSRQTPDHLIGTSTMWSGVRAQILSADIAIDAPACAWDPLAPGYAVKWKPLGSNTYQEPMFNGEPHPLHDVDPAILTCARNAMLSVVEAKEVSAEMSEPIADCIVLALHMEGHL